MSKKGHICFFPGTLHLGGISKMSINIAKELIKRGYRIDFFLSEHEGEYLDILPPEVNLFYGKGSIKSSLFSLTKYLKKESPDAIITARDYINFASILAIKLANVPTKSIVTVRTDYSSLPYESNFDKVMEFFGKYFYRYADSIVAVSDGVAVNHSQRMKLNKSDIEVIYNPAYEETSINENNNEIHPWLSNPKKKVIIGVGRLTEQKNFSLLINAFSKIVKKDELRLIILGEGEDRAKLENLISELTLDEYVYMPGYVNNPLDFISKADVFVLSSTWEGFGNVIVEALGTGTSVVSTDCKSGPSEILKDGEYGKLVPVNNIQVMGKAIQDMLKKPMDEEMLIERAKEFSTENISNQYLDLIYDK